MVVKSNAKNDSLNRFNDDKNQEKLIGTKLPEVNGKMIKQQFITNEVSEDFTYRPARLEDLEEAFELFQACSMAMIGRSEVLFNDVKAEWLLPEFDLGSSTQMIFTPAGKAIGYVEVWDIDEPPVKIWVWGRVHPDYEGLGLGTRLFRWAEKRARQAIPRASTDLQVVMQSGTYSHYDAAHQLLKDQGMTLIRHFNTMAIDLDDALTKPEWPAGIQIRTMLEVNDLMKVVKAISDAFMDHWGFYDRPVEDMYRRWQHFLDHDEDYDPSLWFLAMDGDEIAGVSLCAPKSSEDPNMGWVNTLGVRRPWRRQGLGLALLRHSFAEMARRGKQSVGLGVDAESLTGATRLYERAGMRAIRQFDTYQKVLRSGLDIVTKEVKE